MVNKKHNHNIHQERLVAALNHKISDRVPLTMGSPSCSLHQTAHNNLLEFLSMPPEGSPTITDNILQIVETDKRILDYFDIDMLWLLPKTAKMTWHDQENFTDPLGRKFTAAGGFFNQTIYPLSNCTEEKLHRYKFPLIDKERFSHLGYRAQKLNVNGYGIGIDGPWGLYEISSSLVGTSEYLMSLIINPTLARSVAERVLEEYLIPFYELLLQNTAPFVHVVGISDDLGSQNGLLFSPKLYKQIFKPLHSRLVSFIHSKTNAKIYIHSDGSIYPLIPDLIEIGIDGINPVQYTAKGMDLENLVDEFGKDIGFFGGTIENEALSFSSPSKIRNLVQENVAFLKKKHAFIFAPIHNISQEVPPENIIALYQSGKDFGIY